jgi:hypothetical protein
VNLSITTKVLPGMVATPLTSALRKQRQEGCEFKASLGYIVRCYLKRKKMVRAFVHQRTPS